MTKLFMRSVVRPLGFLSLLGAAAAGAAGFDRFLHEERQLACGVERTDKILESMCHWDAGAKQKGNCNAPEFLDVVGERSLPRACKSILQIAAWPPMPGEPGPGYSEDQRLLFRLLKSLQPIAAAVMKVQQPDCMKSIKPYFELRTKDDFVRFNACLDAVDQQLLQRLSSDPTARLLRRLQEVVRVANMTDQNVVSVIGELTLFFEDNGASFNPATAEGLLGQIAK